MKTEVDKNCCESKVLIPTGGMREGMIHELFEETGI